MKSSPFSVVFVMIVLGSPIVAAQGLPVASPEDVGMSSERLTRIDTFVERHLEAHHFAGAVTLVARRGKIVQFKAYGMQDVESGTPMSKDSIFRIYSMTKPITSVAVMMLYEEGHFLLNDPVSRFLPEFKDLEVGVEAVAAPGKEMHLDILAHSGQRLGKHDGLADRHDIVVTSFLPGYAGRLRPLPCPRPSDRCG